EHGVTVFQPQKLKDPTFIDQLRTLSPDLFIVVAFRILPPEVFLLPKFGSFNLHASLLPKYRGAAPINWAIINGERETGVTTFFLKETVDTGNVILQARIPIGLDETAGEIHDKLSEIGAEVVLHSVRLIEQGKITPKPQNNELASPAPKIFKDDCRIDWKRPAVDVHNFIRGLSPRPCAFTLYNDMSLKIYRSTVSAQQRSGIPGEIISIDKRIGVQTGNGVVEILELQQEGRKKMSAEEFLRGFQMHVGDQFQ
ncbi:MAG TPA: methionyl-tRNA formyltransferase, partial [Bacteroidota bacterium]|nr:methionyl-tRNA formyltransferase [Bacteroidota bacterium]